MTKRTNEEWLRDLRGAHRDEAIEDLRRNLVRGLTYSLAKYSDVRDADVEDFAQDALLKILDALDTFRGEAHFMTWAQKIAVRVAYTELRRRRWKDVSLEELTGDFESDYVPRFLADKTIGPDQQAVLRVTWTTLRRLITEELTEKQRTALIAVRIHGMPMAEVARRMDTNRNALYKLLYDARQRLKRKMQEEDISVEEVLDIFKSQRR